MGKTYLPCDPNQQLLLPAALQELPHSLQNLSSCEVSLPQLAQFNAVSVRAVRAASNLGPDSYIIQSEIALSENSVLVAPGLSSSHDY